MFLINHPIVSFLLLLWGLPMSVKTRSFHLHIFVSRIGRFVQDLCQWLVLHCQSVGDCYHLASTCHCLKAFAPFFLLDLAAYVY